MKKLGNWLGVLVSIAAVAWLLAAYDFGEMGPALRRAQYAWLVPVPLLLLADYALRALRWRLLFRGAARAGIRAVFGALMIGYLFNSLLPARGGEFVKIYLLGSLQGLTKSGVLATVLVEKTADLLIAMALLSLLPLYFPLPKWLTPAAYSVGAMTLAAAGAILYLKLAGAATFAAVFRALKFVPPALLQRIEESSGRFLAGLSGLFSPANALQFAALSAVIWFMELAVMFVIARAFGIPLGASELLFVMLMILFGTMVPSSPGYIGTFEFFGVSALALLGIGGGPALSFVIVLHALVLLVPALIGSLCLLLWKGPRLRIGEEAQIK